MLETDAPDIPPHWLYRTREQRAAGSAQGRNEPARAAAHRAACSRGCAAWRLDELARGDDAQRDAQALPKLARSHRLKAEPVKRAETVRKSTSPTIGDIRYLHLGTEWVQGSMRIDAPFDIELDYVQRMMAWLLFIEPRRWRSGTRCSSGWAPHR